MQRGQGTSGVALKVQRHVALLSDDPNGTVEAGLPSGEVRAGVFEVGGTTVDVILVRVDDPDSGKIWLVSKETVAKIPELYAQMEGEDADGSRTNRACCSDQSAPAGYVACAMAWVAALDPDLMVTGLVVGVSAQVCRAEIWCKLRKLHFQNDLEDATWHAAPVHHCDPDAWPFRLPAWPPLLYRVYYSHFLARPPGGVFRVAREQDNGLGFDHAVNRTRTQSAGGESILIVLQRIDPCPDTDSWLCRRIGRY